MALPYGFPLQRSNLRGVRGADHISIIISAMQNERFGDGGGGGSDSMKRVQGNAQRNAQRALLHAEFIAGCVHHVTHAHIDKLLTFCSELCG